MKACLIIYNIIIYNHRFFLMFEYELKKDVTYIQLKERINSGAYPPEFKLPPEREFCKDFGVSIITLRAALQKLEDEGFLIRKQAKGTFIAPERNRKKELKDHIFVTISEHDEFASPNPYIQQGIRDAIYEANQEIILCGMDYINSQPDMDLRPSLKDKNVTGIICLGNSFRGDEPVIKTFQNTGLPVVIPHGFASDYDTTGFALITADYKKSWSDALEYLAEQGHKRIACLALKENDIRGYTLTEHFKLLEDLGLDTDASLTCNCPYSQKEKIGQIVRSWLKSQNPPTAIMCFSDFLAIDVYNAIKQVNLRIPDDISVMGCCGYPGAAFMDPPLSTIDYEYYKTGHMAVEVLNKAAEWFYAGKSAKPLIVKKHCIVKRASTSLLQIKKDKKSKYEVALS